MFPIACDIRKKLQITSTLQFHVAEEERIKRFEFEEGSIGVHVGQLLHFKH